MVWNVTDFREAKFFSQTGLKLQTRTKAGEEQLIFRIHSTER